MLFHAICRLGRGKLHRPARIDVAALSTHLRRDIGLDEKLNPAGPLWDQQAVTLTARPPSEVSLYFDCMSRPVWRMVSRAASRLTT